MPRTQNELVLQVLESLNAVAAGQTPSAEDKAVIERYIPGRLAELAARSVVYVPDIENIDDEVFEPLVALIANAAGPAFGQAPRVEIRDDAERRLRGLQSVIEYPALRVSYF